MGLSSKRRNGTGEGLTSVSHHRKYSSWINKEKQLKSSKENNEKSTRTNSDKEGGKHNSSSRTGQKSRFFSRASSSRRSTTITERSSFSEEPKRLKRKHLDPLLLARGMSSRVIGSSIASQIKGLSAEEIDRDLRYTEAYMSACSAYSQKYFSFSNPNFVTKGLHSDSRLSFVSTVDSNVRDSPFQNDKLKVDSNNQRDPSYTPSITSVECVTLPVKIDPEGDERMLLLREKVAASEYKREAFETEYLSLREHYLKENQILHKSKNIIYGQLTFLKELLRRRGEILALHRVRCAMARDIYTFLRYKNSKITFSSRFRSLYPDHPNKKRKDINDNMLKIKNIGSKLEENKGFFGVITEKNRQDFLDAWKWIESNIRESEKSCSFVETPKELLSINESLLKAYTTNASLNMPLMDKVLSIDMKLEGNSNEECVSPSHTFPENSSKTHYFLKSTCTRKMSGSSKPFISEDNDNIIPWRCQIMSRTPYDVPLLLSTLCTGTDGSVAFGCGDNFRQSTSSLCWLKSNLPRSMNSDMDDTNEKLVRLQNDVKILSKELKQEIVCNRELQNQAIICKKHNDEVCAMITLLRTEIEAVINRHNIIMESAEARAQSKEIILKRQFNYMDDQGVDEIDDVDIDNDADIEEGESLIVEDEDIGEDELEQTFFDNEEGKNVISYTSDNVVEDSDSFDDDVAPEVVKKYRVLL